jgi:hypothetical protein
MHTPRTVVARVRLSGLSCKNAWPPGSSLLLGIAGKWRCAHSCKPRNWAPAATAVAQTTSKQHRGRHKACSHDAGGHGPLQVSQVVFGESFHGTCLVTFPNTLAFVVKFLTTGDCEQHFQPLALVEVAPLRYQRKSLFLLSLQQPPNFLFMR